MPVPELFWQLQRSSSIDTLPPLGAATPQRLQGAGVRLPQTVFTSTATPLEHDLDVKHTASPSGSTTTARASELHQGTGAHADASSRPVREYNPRVSSSSALVARDIELFTWGPEINPPGGPAGTEFRPTMVSGCLMIYFILFSSFLFFAFSCCLRSATPLRSDRPGTSQARHRPARERQRQSVHLSI